MRFPSRSHLLGAVAGFGLLTLAVWAGPPWLVQANLRLSEAMRDPAVTDAAALLTHAGDPTVLAALLLIAAGLQWRWGRPDRARVIIGAALVAAMIRWGLLPVIASIRPVSPHAEGLGFSYPSGHTLYSTSAAMILFFLARPHVRRSMLALITCLWPATVGVTRVILGAHWPTDVIGGLLLALAVVPMAMTAACPAELTTLGHRAKTVRRHNNFTDLVWWGSPVEFRR